ncbi:MAG: cysteine--tRNA ligase [Candidatus Moeniiplasma glomeromycotorum]|nr:cysteine--tRNA ligase [Candidatus Moeniiplasma glomeromycotorum]MCE8167489.1 cysteine--tRNA ligase [Candidatus Moeniiplasma glomeromycotorum]
MNAPSAKKASEISNSKQIQAPIKLKLFNSLKKKVSELIIYPGQKINLYLCGPTVYGPVHLGNLRPVIIFDLLHRLLLSLKIKVNYVQNITDIDDKIIVKAQQTGQSELEVSQHYTKAYFDNLVCYNILFPTTSPRVTNYIPSLQKFIAELEKKGAAYQRAGEVFFRIGQQPEYGKLSGQNLVELKKNVREIIQAEKENSHDFVLWKKTPRGLAWDSPWGKGRPGWHTECAVFIQELFTGQMIEIHGGGNDLLFPHHENERIQYLVRNARELSKVWVHVAHLHWQEKKMSKSLGNVILAKTFVRQYGSNLFRYLLLSSSYRQAINFNQRLIEQATNYLQKIENLLKRLNFYLYTEKIKIRLQAGPPPQEIINCLLNDLNTSRALFWLEKMIVTLNKEITQKKNNPDFQAAVANFYFTLDLLGFKFEIPPYSLKIKLLIRQWQKLVGMKKYGPADGIRKELIKNNVI